MPGLVDIFAYIRHNNTESTNGRGEWCLVFSTQKSYENILWERERESQLFLRSLWEGHLRGLHSTHVQYRVPRPLWGPLHRAKQTLWPLPTLRILCVRTKISNRKRPLLTAQLMFIKRVEDTDKYRHILTCYGHQGLHTVLEWSVKCTQCFLPSDAAGKAKWQGHSSSTRSPASWQLPVPIPGRGPLVYIRLRPRTWEWSLGSPYTWGPSQDLADIYESADNLIWICFPFIDLLSKGVLCLHLPHP